jgi:alkylation response protein AidB-like acyl-CoA dehydrogenase
VYLSLTNEQQDLKDELRAYFVRLVDEVQGSDDGEPSYTRYIRRMGEDGWLGLGWPREYGGQARGPIEQMIFVEESHWRGSRFPSSPSTAWVRH